MCRQSEAGGKEREGGREGGREREGRRREGAGKGGKDVHAGHTHTHTHTHTHLESRNGALPDFFVAPHTLGQ